MDMNGQIQADLAVSPLGKEHEYPLSKRVGGPHSQAVRFEEEINILLMSVIELRFVQLAA
jgi:hypothetical protein